MTCLPLCLTAALCLSLRFYQNLPLKLIVSLDIAIQKYCAGLPTTKALLEKCVDIIMGLGFPLSKTGNPKDKKLANEIIHGGLMAELFTGGLAMTQCFL